ncbi:hypothetical protein [Campylobacter sputorum]|nr:MULTISPECIES: hypothetical protein [Campylobacter]
MKVLNYEFPLTSVTGKIRIKVIKKVQKLILREQIAKINKFMN